MKRTTPVIALWAVMACAVLSAQAPNFSGTWTLVPDAAAAASPFTMSELTAAQDAKTLTVTGASGQMGEIKTTYNLDGTEAKSPLDFNGNSIDRVTTLVHDGSKLVLTAKSDFGGQSFETKEVWSMSADGTLVIERTFPDFQGGGAPTTTKATYRKK